MLSEEGRATFEREFKDAPLLFDGKKRNARGEDGADRYNAERLEQLSRDSCLPILGIRALHARPAGTKPERMDDDQFRGLIAELRLAIGARVLLMTNEWVEAGLVNGAVGTVRGFMFPDGFDPNSEQSRLSTPLCVVVEFDDVRLPEGKSFFPGEPGKERWIPIFRSAPVVSQSDDNITREQFPLTLAWALTHWKAQGMTLQRVRICMRDAVATIAGIGYVAITRVKHPEHLLFEEDLPSWETFQEAKRKPGFRQRRRMELRFLAKFSRTLRRYGFCEEDRWSEAERDVADALLAELKARGRKELDAARHERGKANPTQDTWPWAAAGPDIPVEVAAAVARVRKTSSVDAGLLLPVAGRLQAKLHLPAVMEALQCLIPGWLGPALDDKQRKGPRGDADRVGVEFSCKCWGVDVACRYGSFKTG